MRDFYWRMQVLLQSYRSLNYNQTKFKHLINQVGYCVNSLSNILSIYLEVILQSSARGLFCISSKTAEVLLSLFF